MVTYIPLISQSTTREAQKYIRDDGVGSKAVNHFKTKVTKECKLLDLLLIKGFYKYKIL